MEGAEVANRLPQGSTVSVSADGNNYDDAAPDHAVYERMSVYDIMHDTAHYNNLTESGRKEPIEEDKVRIQPYGPSFVAPNDYFALTLWLYFPQEEALVRVSLFLILISLEYLYFLF